MKLRLAGFFSTATLAVLAFAAGCSSDPDPTPAPPGTGGTPAAGAPAAGTGGLATGGIVGAGGTTGGIVGAGGTTGGTTGGSTTGGATGGSPIIGGGGSGTGGSATAGGGMGGKAGGAAGGGAGGAPVDDIPATFETVELILGSNLGCRGCHGSDMMMNLNGDPGLYMRLTTRVSHLCGDIPVVNKGNPEQSALVKMLRGTCPPPFPIMPTGCDPAMIDIDLVNCLESKYTNAVARWIAAGAPEN